MAASQQPETVAPLKLKLDVPIFNLAGLVVREKQQVNAVVVGDPFRGETTPKKSSFNEVDAKIRNDMFAGPTLFMSGSVWDCHRDSRETCGPNNMARIVSGRQTRCNAPWERIEQGPADK